MCARPPRGSALSGPALCVERLQDVGNLRYRPAGAPRELACLQRTVFACEDDLSDRYGGGRPLEGPRHMLLSPKLSGFANYDQSFGSEDSDLAGLIGPVRTAVAKPLEGSGGKPVCEQHDVGRPRIRHVPRRTANVLRPPLSGPLDLNRNRAAVARLDHEVGARGSRRRLDDEAIDGLRQDLLISIFCRHDLFYCTIRIAISIENSFASRLLVFGHNRTPERTHSRFPQRRPAPL